MRASDDPIVLALDAAVHSSDRLRYINDVVRRTAETLRSSERPMAWETLPLDLFEAVPSDILSCWVFVLRASQDTGAERHPNSHQRSLSLAGEGHVELLEEREWRSYALSSDLEALVDARWATIPRNVWHRWGVGPVDWAVLSFHTIGADELIEERPVMPNILDTGPTEHRTYHD